MSLTYNKKIKVEFSKEDECVLDGQSKICNWLYNQLLDACQKDYKENNNHLKLLEGRNLRNYGVSLKDKHLFLHSVFSSPLKEPATRLVKAYKNFFKGRAKYPRFRSWKKKWFSLVFDEPNKGWEILNEGKNISISLGNIPRMQIEKGKRNPSIKGRLKEKIELKEGEILKTFSLCKQQGKQFFAIFTFEKCSNKELDHKIIMSDYRKSFNLAKKEGKELPEKPTIKKVDVEIPIDCKWIALDPNHKNFFVGVDDQGNSIEFKKLQMIKYWDKKIDEIKSHRDVCEKKYRNRKTKHGNSYTVHSPRWNRLNHVLNKAYHKRREQIKTALYTTTHELFRRYDLVIVGNYTPTNGTAPFDHMKRSMLNQEKMGEFRKIVEWVAAKLGKYYLLANERNTTKDCCVCGHQEKKDPSIRHFVCMNCGTEMMRDSNSSVNIGKKVGFLLDVQKYKHNLKNFTHKGKVLYGQSIYWFENKI
jgi:putative transposase